MVWFRLAKCHLFYTTRISYHCWILVNFLGSLFIIIHIIVILFLLFVVVNIFYFYKRFISSVIVILQISKVLIIDWQRRTNIFSQDSECRHPIHYVIFFKSNPIWIQRRTTHNRSKEVIGEDHT